MLDTDSRFTIEPEIYNIDEHEPLETTLNGNAVCGWSGEGVKLQAADISGALRSSVSFALSRINKHQVVCNDCLSE